MRDSTGARIIFPTSEDKDQELITVVGTEEAVKEAQKELEELIKSLVKHLFVKGAIPHSVASMLKRFVPVGLEAHMQCSVIPYYGAFTLQAQ